MSSRLMRFGVTYRLLLARKAQKFYEKADSSLAKRLNACFDQLQAEPFTHPNIKRLSTWTQLFTNTGFDFAQPSLT